jgi:hypothetical protein
MTKGGFDIFEGLLDKATFDRMLAETFGLLPTAKENEVTEPDQEELRGGKPPRRFLNSPGGTVQAEFYYAGWMRRFVRQITGIEMTPTGSSGSYSYYVRPGDYIGLHRDIITCDLAVISCLFDNAHPAIQGGTLCLYPERIYEPLSSIRASLQQGPVPVKLIPGQTILMFGGTVPHWVLPVVEGQKRIVSVLCYQA